MPYAKLLGKVLGYSMIDIRPDNIFIFETTPGKELESAGKFMQYKGVQMAGTEDVSVPTGWGTIEMAINSLYGLSDSPANMKPSS